MNYRIKRAAMFGLDARIALAIFGALSVISGAALYSAIENTKITKFMVYVNEVQKAATAFYLDVGEFKYYNNGDGVSLYRHLWSNDYNFNNWNGPYLTSSDLSLINEGLLSQSFRSLYSNTWSANWTNLDCVVGQSCVLWLYYDFAKDGIGEILDNKYDDGDNCEGKIRYKSFSSTRHVIAISMEMPMPIP